MKKTGILTRSRMIEQILVWDRFLYYDEPDNWYNKKDLMEIRLDELWMIYDAMRDEVKHGW